MLSCMKTGRRRRPLGLSLTFLQIISDILADGLRHPRRPSPTFWATMVALAIENRTISNNLVRYMSQTMVELFVASRRFPFECESALPMVFRKEIIRN